MMYVQLRRIQATTSNGGVELPTVKLDCTVDDFFADIEDRTQEGAILPNWYV